MSDDRSSKVAGPSTEVMAGPVTGGMDAVGSSQNSSVQTTYERYWSAANEQAEPDQSQIRRRLAHFPSPPLRIPRVSQLDAELLDTELTSMLLEPLKAALRNIRITLPTTLEPELLLTLRLALYKFSIWDRGATYGAMIQNLRYRNEWAHRGGLQSTSKDARLWRVQLILYPTLTIILPYLHTKFERRMSNLSFSDLPSTDYRRKLFAILDRVQRLYSALSLANFLAFLKDGKYRTLTDRLLGMRLAYAQRTMNRNVSFEFLNRQLVWHAFTEFLLFLLPLIRPRRLIRQITRISTHRWILSIWLAILPKFISKRVGLYKDDKGRSRINLYAILPESVASQLVGGSGKGDGSSGITIAKYPQLPKGVCAICWERLEDQAGIKTAGQSVLRSGMPSLDPNDPTSSSSLPIDGAGKPVQPKGLATKTTNALSSLTSSNGLAYADALVHTPYRVEPCGHTYCYVCIAGKLLADEAGEELQESNLLNGGDEGGENDDKDESNLPAAWHCLRCGKGVRKTRRDVGGIVLDDGKGKEKVENDDEKEEEEIEA